MEEAFRATAVVAVLSEKTLPETVPAFITPGKDNCATPAETVRPSVPMQPRLTNPTRLSAVSIDCTFVLESTPKELPERPGPSSTTAKR